MEKNLKKNFKEDAVDITKIYEVIRDKGFIQDLWSDVLSDLRQKPSYLQLKNMVEKVIETSVENYATKPKDHEERLKTRTTFTDIGIMTYTIDTLISDVLKKKLKDELQSMISKVIDDGKDSTKSSNTDNNPKKVTMLEDIGKLLCSSDQNNKPNKSEASTSSQEDLSRSLSKSAVPNKPAARKDKRLKTSEQKTSFVANGSPKKTNNIINSTSRSPSKRIKNINKKSSKILDDENSDVDVIKVSDDEDINHSIRSVSSVHTSDLSSFEDDISISSEDENGVKCKKRVSLKLANDLCNSGRLSDLYKIAHTPVKQESPRPSSNNSFDSLCQRSSTRMRKPNSKYASDDVVCPMKIILSSNDSYFSDKEINEDARLTENSEKRESSPNKVFKKQRNTYKELKNSINKTNSIEDSDSLNESDSSLDKNKKKIERKGQLKKNKFTFPKKSAQNSSIEHISKETTAKRGRPSKSSSDEPVATKKHCVLDNILPQLEKKMQLKSVETKQPTQNIPQWRDHKKGKSLNKNSVEEMADESSEHSIESFSKFEERICLKDQSSPSKSNKSYDSSDLYKPRSDFRIFNSSRGSKAFTLFSN